jgi:hypothetical protein
MSIKPTLHEIAAMPFPKSVEAMRKHYVRDWGKPIPEGVTKKRKFRVDVEYEVSYSDTQTVEVEAWTANEAEDLAANQVAESAEQDASVPFPDVEICGSRAMLVSETVQ